MKEISIVIPKARLEDLNQVLHKLKVGGVSYYNISGRGRGQHHEPKEVRTYEGYDTGRAETLEFESRTKVEIVVPDSRKKEIIDDVLRALGAGPEADGKVFVKDIPEAYDIRSKESGESAL
jgi:nitrogen regulatory protein P-II 1